MFILRRSALRFGLIASSLLAGPACNSAVAVGETDTDTDGGGGTQGPATATGEDSSGESGNGGSGQGILLEVNRDVDILFVVDNSGSMGEEQANLAENIGRFFNVLESDEVQANYRVGITTTDDSNYWCRGAGVSDAESGQFVLSSCRSRLGDFYFSGDDTDAEAACTDFCGLDSIQMQPTTTDDDPTPSVRPWLENLEGASNLPKGVTSTQAMQCFAPQGINGCGFESHLE